MTRYSRDISRRQRRDRRGRVSLSRWWYGRASEDGQSWRWIRLYEDEKSSRKAWTDLKATADRIESGVTSIEAERLKLPLTKLFDLYHADLKRSGASPAHVEISRSMLARLIRLANWTNWRDIHTANAHKILDELAAADLTASYLNKIIMRLKAFVRWALPEGHANPLAKLKRVSESNAKRRRARRAATPAELSALLALPIPHHRRLAYALAAYNGLRRNEVAKLTWDDIDLDNVPPTATLRQKMGGDAADVIPLHPFVVSLLADRQNTGRIVPSVPDVKTLKKDWVAAKVAFVDGRGARLDYHALRHTFSTAVSRAGASRTTLRALMRHSHVTVTDRYTHAELDELYSVVCRVPWPRPKMMDAQMDQSKGAVSRESVDNAGSSIAVSHANLTVSGVSTTLLDPLAGYPSGVTPAEHSRRKTEPRTPKRTIETIQSRRRRVLLRLFVNAMKRSEGGDRD